MAACLRATLLGTLAFLFLGIGPAGATSFGTLSNFDVVNDTSGPCHGFEIELEDVNDTDVVYTFGGSYTRYGAPEVLNITVDPTHPRTLVRYRHWNGSSWEATPLAPPNITPSGHDCFANGPIGNYENSGCEHYGVSLTASPSQTHYRWIVANDPADMSTAFSAVPQPVNLPVPVFAVLPPPPGGGANVNVRAEVEPVEEEQQARHGEPQWMKVFKIESELDLQPEDLVRLLLGGPDNILPGETEIETEWKLIQSKPGNAEGEEEDADVKEDPLDAGKHSVIRRYEFYTYTGPRDPENNEALPCIDDDSPVAPDAPVEGCSDLGDFVGAQNVAVDIDLAAADSNLPAGEVGLAYGPLSLLVGGLPPYNVAVGGDVPDGLAVDDTTGVLAGTPTADGQFAFTLDAEDAATDVVHASFDLAILAAVTIETEALPQAIVGECYFTTVAATGGLPPYTWSEIKHDLPGWADTENDYDVAGCPDENDVDVSMVTFTVTDALGATHSKTLALEVVGAPEPTATSAATATLPLPTATATPTGTAAATVTATATPEGCVGDCGSDGAVNINELITLVNIALEAQPPSTCAALGPDATVNIAMLVRAVGNALSGCG